MESGERVNRAEHSERERTRELRVPHAANGRLTRLLFATTAARPAIRPPGRACRISVSAPNMLRINHTASKVGPKASDALLKQLDKSLAENGAELVARVKASITAVGAGSCARCALRLAFQSDLC